MEHSSLKIKLKTEHIYHEFNYSTIYDKYFELMINSNNKLNNDKIYTDIIKYIDTNPDMLLFSENDILENINNIEYILIINNDIDSDKFIDKKIIYLDISSKYYAKLKNFEIIGKLFFV